MGDTGDTLEKAVPAWYAPFLTKLAKSPNVSAACRAVKIGRKTAYRYRESDPTFAADWDTALNTAIDTLVGEAYRRATVGVKRTKGIYRDGKQVGTETETVYSDALAIFLLKSHRPEVYRETVRNEHTGKDGGPMRVAHGADLTTLDEADLDLLDALLAKATPHAG